LREIHLKRIQCARREWKTDLEAEVRWNHARFTEVLEHLIGSNGVIDPWP
jgi:hypothetical protein